MKKLALIILVSFFSASSYAQDAFYVSGMLGLTSFEESGTPISLDYDTELSYGLRGGLLFNDHVSAGLFINRYGTEISTIDISLTNIMAEVTYYFAEADENSFWLSGLLGLTQSKVDSGLVSVENSDTAFGFSAGYHFMVAPNWSLSPQFTYVRTNFEDGSGTQLSAIANVTLWL